LVHDTAVEVAGPDEALWAACRQPPEPLRTAVVLRFYEDMEYAAIAALKGIREGSVRSRVSRGLAILRTELGADDE
jgi:DNA-directed RNA polymerase specialized sigma24 family protein